MRQRVCGTLDQAYSSACGQAADAAGFVIPVILFQQGTRTVATGVIQMGMVVSHLDHLRGTKQAKKKDGRVAAIFDRLRDNHDTKYLLAPLTLHVRDPLDCYAPEYAPEIRTRPGYLVAPGTTTLAVAEGQHRVRAIGTLVDFLAASSREGLAAFFRQGVAVMLVFENDADQRRRDVDDVTTAAATGR